MHVAFVNPQGNFDPKDSYWTAHPDFGGQLVYVKELALAMGSLGHRVDIVTRQIEDPEWPEFASGTDAYPGHDNVRILRIPCGPDGFLPKEDLWPYLGTEFVPRLLDHYRSEGSMPDAVTAHYGDGGLCAALMQEWEGIPFSFTAHSLGAQKMDKLGVNGDNAPEIERRYHFSDRLLGERLAMNRSSVNVTSTAQERYNQYTHNAYRGAIDPTDDARFAAVPPGVALHIFDKDSRADDEDATHEHVRAAIERDVSPERRDLPCVVASSRLDPKKNHLSLVEAFAASPTLRQTANLVVVTGDLEDPLSGYSDAAPDEREVLDSLMAVIDRDGMRGEISMFALHNQRELAAAYRYLAGRRSIFALTANYEPFGLAPLEAMAAGLPAVVTKHGGPSESLRTDDEEFGILVDPLDPEEVGAGLYTLAADPDRWQRYAEAGYGRVIDKYTWERTAEGYLEAISGRDDTASSEKEAPGDGEPAEEYPAVAAGLDQRPDRLEIPSYFTSTTDDGRDPLAVLDELYFALDVLAVGETLVDFISHQRATSLRTAGQFVRYLGGQPANVAVYAAKLGGRSAILSSVGTDYFGEYLEDQLQRHGVSTEALGRTSKAASTTTFVTKTVGVPDFQVNRGADTLLELRDVPEALISRTRVVHTSAFALSREPQRLAVRRALRLASRLGKIVSFDPNYDQRLWPDREEAWEVMAEILPHVSIAKPSAEDARRLFDPNLSEEALEEKSLHEFHDLGAETVIFTRSGGIVTVSDRTNGSEVERIGPLPTVEIENVTGARDAFWSGLLMARLDGHDWATAVWAAHEVASLKLRVEGHVRRMVDRQEIYRRLDVPVTSGTA